MESNNIRINKLTNGNWPTWKYKVELLLLKDGLQDVVSRARNNDEDEATWNKKDGQAKAIIGLSLEDSQLIHVRKLKTAKEYWDALKQYHEQCTVTSKVFILKKLCRSVMQENGNMEEHIASMLDLVDQYHSQEANALPDSLVVALILSSLPESYSTMITALESRKDDELTINLVKNKLIHEFRRRNESQQINENEIALKVGTKPDYRSENKNKSSLKCFHCNKLGHLKRDCYFLKNKQNKYGKEKLHQANKITEETNEISNSNRNYCFKVDSNGKVNNTNWYIDSAATCHMTNNEKFFTQLNRVNNGGKIYLADGSSLDTSGVGDGALQCYGQDDKPTNVTIKNVLFIPELDGSLLSVKKLTDIGYTLKFENKSCYIMKDTETIASANNNDHLYKLEIAHMANKVTTEKECIHTWHRRMGHRNVEAIQRLIKENLADGVTLTECGIKCICECCIKGKMARLSFPKESFTRANENLDLIHSDLCGPMSIITPSGNRYVLTLIDDYSRYTTVYFLKKKSEVNEKFRHFCAEVENKFGRKIKTIRTDNGGEYTSNKFEDYLKDMGICHHKSAPYSPQQNGIAERKNRSLMEMARCMILDANMPKLYWAEAVNTANYLYNRLPTNACAKTPYELWNGVKPDLSKLKIFGSKAYSKLPDEKRKKLDDKAKEYTFVGYADNTKAYRLLDIITNETIISRDVKFIEEIPNCQNDKANEEKHVNKEISERNLINKNNELIEIILNSDNNQMNSSTEENEVTENIVINEKEIITENNTEEVNEIQNRYPKRARNPPKRFACKTMFVEPKSLKEALEGEDKEKWQIAIQEEMNSLMKNNTWELQLLPKGKNVIGSKWIFKIKTNENGEIVRYKARLVAQGFTQKYGVDYDESFAPVVKQTTIRTLMTIAGAKRMHVKHVDIKTAFLNGDIEEEIFMKQPDGFVQAHERKLVCRLHKGLYGLKQSARAWNTKLNDVLIKNCFKRGISDPCLYTKIINGNHVYVLIYIDDILLVSDNEKEIQNFEEMLKKEFEITLLGNVSNFLGLQIERDDNGIFKLHQTKYINKVIESFLTEDAKPSKIPLDPGYYKLCANSKPLLNNEQYRKAIGSLLYIAVNTRPDIAASVSILSRKVSCPTELDWLEVKRVLRYLIGTKSYKLALGKNTGTHRLIGYADADWAQDQTDRKSNTGYLFQLYGGTITWASRKQTCIALSSTEAEYVSLTEACQEAKWIHSLLQDLDMLCPQSTTIYEDNQSCLKLLDAEKLNPRTKHIDIKYHFTREIHKSGEIEFMYCPTEHMVADILTKPLAAVKMKQLSKGLGLNDSC